MLVRVYNPFEFEGIHFRKAAEAILFLNVLDLFRGLSYTRYVFLDLQLN